MNMWKMNLSTNFRTHTAYVVRRQLGIVHDRGGERMNSSECKFGAKRLHTISIYPNKHIRGCVNMGRVSARNGPHTLSANVKTN